MRKRLTLLVTATVGIVLVVFVIPLGLIVQRFVAERATDAATTSAETLVVLVGTADPGALRAAVDQLDATDAAPVTVFLPDGSRLGAPAGRTVAVQLAEHGRSVTVTTADGREIALAVAGAAGGTAVVRTFVSNAQLAQGVGRAWLTLALLALALLLLAVLLADRLARSMVRSIGSVAEVSRRLAAGGLDARAESAGPAEVRDVSAALNQLAGRIQELVDQAREEVADLSHRLRTPLTALRMEVDLMSSEGAGAEQIQRVAARVEGMERAVTELIQDSRRRGAPAAPQSCDAAVVVREQVEFWAPLAEDEGRRLTVRLAGSPLLVRVGAAELRACVDALLGNVFTHTPAGTAFGVTLESVTGGAVLRVADRGPGLGNAGVPRRGVSGGGSTGLGLDIARRTAQGAGGRFRVDGSASGVRVELEFGSAPGG